MKKLKTLFCFLLILALNSCNDKDDGTVNRLDGTWKLINISGTIAGINENYPEGAINWTFNTTNKTVSVVNTTSPLSPDGLATGTYSYVISQNLNTTICNQKITINNIDFGCFDLSDSNLKLTQSFIDGIDVHLIR
jgi:hypothetical protein